jgi:oxygen-independent coproporphyrinogen-3 oxidase
LIWGRPVISVFIGGGTPSLLGARGVDRLLSDLRALLPLAADCEITLEANPGTFEAERFASYRASGINRLSIGIQSFAPEKLAALGRIHDREQALAAVAIAARTFENFNLDLMYALPGQSMADLQADVEQALAFAPPHLSLYQLTLEPNTVFAKHPPALPDEDLAASMQDGLEQRTGAAGYRQYEISAYARGGRECRHNQLLDVRRLLGRWRGAHSKIFFRTDPAPGEIQQPGTYLRQANRREFLAESAEARATTCRSSSC